MMIDAIVGITAILGFYRGWKKGVVSAILSVIGVVLGTIFSLQLSQTLAAFLSSKNWINSNYVLPISFIVIFVATVFLVRMIIKAAEGALKFAMLGWANKLAGALLYVFLNVFFVSALIWLANGIGLVTPSAQAESKTYSWVQPIAPGTISVLQEYLPFCKNLLQRVKTAVTPH